MRELVEMHDGAVSAESPGEGKGASFTVRLPVCSGALPGSEAAPTAPVEPALLPTILRGVRVLIVDDDGDARVLVRRVLKDFAATTTEAGGVEEAIRLLEASPPDVLVSDIGMPNRDGYDLIREIRNRGYTPEALPAIALTAFARPEDEEHSVRCGFQLCLSKPIDTKYFIHTIASLLGRAKAYDSD